MSSYSLLGSKGSDEADKDDDLDFGFIPRKSRDGGLYDLPIERIKPDPNQPRTSVEAVELDTLEKQIDATNGITKPIDVYEDPVNPSFYIIEDGEQRWTIYQRKEWTTIPARILNHQPEQSSDITLRQLLANIGRIDMTLLDVAKGLDDWRKAKASEEGVEKISNRRVAEAFGWNYTRVSRTLKLLDAPRVIQDETTKTTNINTLSYMQSVYNADPSLFDRCLEWFNSPDFQENAEKYWRGVLNDLSKDDSKDSGESDNVGIKEDRSTTSLTDPAPCETSSDESDASADNTQSVEPKSSRISSSQEQVSPSKPKHATPITGKDGSIVSGGVAMNGGVAVLQLSILPPGADINAYEKGDMSGVEDRHYQFDTVSELDELLRALEKAKKEMIHG